MKNTVIPDVPKGVLVLTAGIDVNERTTNYEIVGWGPQYESWGIEYGAINEDPRQPRLWEELNRLLYQRRFTCGDGEQMEIRKIAIDSGYLAEPVYKFTAKRTYRVIATKGRSYGLDRPFLYANARITRGMVRTLLLELNVDRGKRDVVYWFDKISAPGPGYCHLPLKDGHRSMVTAISTMKN